MCACVWRRRGGGEVGEWLGVRVCVCIRLAWMSEVILQTRNFLRLIKHDSNKTHIIILRISSISWRRRWFSSSSVAASLCFSCIIQDSLSIAAFGPPRPQKRRNLSHRRRRFQSHTGVLGVGSHTKDFMIFEFYPGVGRYSIPHQRFPPKSRPMWDCSAQRARSGRGIEFVGD